MDDLLSSLHISSLPEQQTRTSEPRITKALTSNPDIRLGFDACCNCASPSIAVQCETCQRVKYCSKACLRQDANPDIVDDDEDDVARGHSSVICSLLRLCRDDETAEEEMTNEKRNKAKRQGASTFFQAKKTPKNEAAEDRLRSEFESYPATLANVLADGPCFRETIRRRSSKQTHHAATKTSQADEDEDNDDLGGGLTIHIIGSTEQAELSDSFRSIPNAYTEALTDFAESNALPEIHLVFVGPDCISKTTQSQSWKCPAKNRHYRIVIETHRSEYHRRFLQTGSSDGSSSSSRLRPPPAADIIVLFNPGFTCSEYAWDEALGCIEPQTPFLVTSNTELEAVMDCQYLFEKGFVSTLPRMVQTLLNAETTKQTKDDFEEEEERTSGMFFGENPFCGSRVRQSGNMANDVFVKSRFLFGGVWGMVARDADRNRDGGVRKPFSSERKRRVVTSECDSEIVSNKYHHRVRGDGNRKKDNPALI